MPNSLQIRYIECHFILNAGQFKSGGNTKIIKCNSDNVLGDRNNGLSVHAEIKKTSGLNQDECNLIIYGIIKDDIAQLTTLNYQLLYYQKNQLIIYAGYNDTNLSLVFKGDIIQAQGDYSDTNRPLHVLARTGFFDNIQVAQHINVEGQTTAFNIFSKLANTLKLSLSDNANTSSIQLFNHILTGGATEQVQTLANQVNIDAKSDGNNLYLTKRNNIIKNNVQIDVNANTGLLSYPKINQNGVIFRMRFDTNVRWGGTISLVSEAPKTTGIWRTYSLTYTLENLGSKFEIEVQGSRFGFGF